MRGDVLLLCLFCVSFRFTPVLSFKHKYTHSAGVAQQLTGSIINLLPLQQLELPKLN